MKKTWTTAAGTVIDEAAAERMAAAFEADDDVIEQAVAKPVRRAAGRPGLKGTIHGGRSPKVEFRLGEEGHAKLKALAEREHRPVSALAREATEQYLRSRV